MYNNFNIQGDDFNNVWKLRKLPILDWVWFRGKGLVPAQMTRRKELTAINL